MTPPTAPDTGAIRQKIDAAKKMVSDLCNRRREWVMSVPAQPDYDPDLVIAGALAAAEAEITRLQSALSVSQAQGEVMREALKPFAKIYEAILLHGTSEYAREVNKLLDEALNKLNIGGLLPVRDVERAHKALQSTPPTAVGRVIEAARDLIADVQARYPGAGTAEPFRCPIMQRMSEALAVLDGRKG